MSRDSLMLPKRPEPRMRGLLHVLGLGDFLVNPVVCAELPQRTIGSGLEHTKSRQVTGACMVPISIGHNRVTKLGLCRCLCDRPAVDWAGLAALRRRRPTHSAAARCTATLRLACSSTQRRSRASPTNRVAINHRRQTLDQQRSTMHAARRHANVICVNRCCAPPIHKCAPAPQRRQDGVHGPRLALASGAAAAAA